LICNRTVFDFVRLQVIDSKSDTISSTGNVSLSLGLLSLDAEASGGLWQPVKPTASSDAAVRSGRVERSNSFDSHSSDGLGFNARDGNGLCAVMLSSNEKM
jgi:hypothetical protein